MEEAVMSGTTRLGGQSRARLVIIESDVGSTRRVGDDTILVVINGDGKGWEGEPATGMVTNKAAAIAMATVNEN
jgi:hypothetical protein